MNTMPTDWHPASDLSFDGLAYLLATQVIRIHGGHDPNDEEIDQKIADFLSERIDNWEDLSPRERTENVMRLAVALMVVD